MALIGNCRARSLVVVALKFLALGVGLVRMKTMIVHQEVAGIRRTSTVMIQDLKNKDKSGIQEAEEEKVASISTDLPVWLREYGVWHQNSRSELNETNWRLHRFLVLTARPNTHSGGLTDRLRPLPYFLKLAASTKRILLIHWTRPFALENFLLPPQGGLDWRTPPFMVEAVNSEGRPLRRQRVLTPAANKTRNKLIAVQMQNNRYGEGWYNNNTLSQGEPPVEATFRSIWNWAFTPAPTVAQLITDEFNRMGIKPGNYAAAHIRAAYGIHERDASATIQMAHRAMDCISQVAPGGPFFVASDTALAAQAAMEYGKSKNVTVVASTNRRGEGSRQPLHLDIYNESHISSLTPEDFYDTFLDLYLLGSTRCVAYGAGGFGKWGKLLGFNSTCEIQLGGRLPCTWKSIDDAGNNDHMSDVRAAGDPSEQGHLSPRALFHPPMLHNVLNCT